MVEQNAYPTDPFDEEGYINLVLANISGKQTQREVARIKEALALPESARILDFGCGNGRHSLALAQDCQVTGIDLSSKLINLAQEQAKKTNPPPLFVQADMRGLPFVDSSFDAAFNLFTSFGFYGKEDDSRAFQEVRRILRPGGRFLLETFTKDNLSSLPYTSIWNAEDRRVIQNIWSFEERTNLLVITRHASDLRQAVLRLYLYSEGELAQMFSAAQLQVVGRSLQPQTSSVPLNRLSIIGEKVSAHPPGVLG